MKYSPLKKQKEKLFNIPVLNGGINISKKCTDINDNQLADCKNVFYNGNSLATRLGLKANKQGVLDLNDFSGSENIEYKTTDTEIFIDGEFKKIVTANIKYDNSHRFICVYLISADSKIQSIGNMHFSRVDESTFFIPKSVVFYKGTAVNGGGIFALVHLENLEGVSSCDYRIYEVNSDFNAWIRCNNFYIPTVYINGRGNNYDSIDAIGIENKEKPRILERLNMLSGNFYAYFSSDGYSNSFRLPFSNLANSAVFVRIHSGLDEYTEWNIAEGKNSDTQNFFGSDVIAYVDREKGTVYFKKDNTDFAVPMMGMYKENNIRILAEKDIADGMATIVSARCAAAFGQNVILAGGKSGEQLYYADYGNPLYFPLVNDNSIGSADMPITALAVSKQRVIAFKKNEIYVIQTKGGNAVNETALLVDNGKTFKNAVSFDINRISGAVGCELPQSLALYNDECIWLSGDGKVYSLSNNRNELKCLSQNIDKLIEFEYNNEKTVSCVFENNYILCNGRNAVIMNYTDKTPAWYVWEFPQKAELVGLFGKNDEIALVCQNSGSDFCYTASLSGDSDLMLDNNGNEKRYEIASVIKTRNFALGKLSGKTRVNRIFLSAFAERSAEIEIGSNNKCTTLLYENNMLTNDGEFVIRLLPDMQILRTVYLKLSSRNGISLGGADIYYFEAN